MDESTTKSTKWTSLLLTPQKWKNLLPSLQSRRAYNHEVDGPITKVYEVDEFNISPKVGQKTITKLTKQTNPSSQSGRGYYQVYEVDEPKSTKWTTPQKWTRLLLNPQSEQPHYKVHKTVDKSTINGRT